MKYKYLPKNERETKAAAHMTWNKTVDNIFKKPLNEPYQVIVSFTETSKIKLFSNKKYKVLVSIGLRYLRMRPCICVFSTGAGSILVQVDVLDPTWLVSIHQRGMPEIRLKMLTLRGTITLHIWIGESRIRVTLSIVD